MVASSARGKRRDGSAPDDVTALEKVLVEAGEAARDLFDRRRDLLVDKKSPGQFVSDADRQIEDFIRGRLRESFGDQPVIGEEFGGEFQGDGWVIDPIDGTSNFLCGIPLWSISIAYMSENAPVLGGVFAPCVGRLVAASRGRGLRLNRNRFTRPARPSPVPTYSVGENTVWSIAESRATIDRLREAGMEIVRLRSASQSLAMVGLRELEGFVEEHLKLWDIAAGWLICEEAGVPVTVVQLNGHARSIWAGAALQ